MSKYRDGRTATTEQVRALEKLEGYPLKPSFVGSACRHFVPEAYAPGAPGWTDKLAEIRDVLDANGAPVPDAVEVELPDTLLEKHRGKVVDVGGRPVTIRNPHAKPHAQPSGR